MIGFGNKRFATVVTDGSDIKVLKDITGIINMVTEERHGRASHRSLSSDHPTMMVIEVWTNNRAYKLIQELLENLYPGLCIFNPVM